MEMAFALSAAEGGGIGFSFKEFKRLILSILGMMTADDPVVDAVFLSL
jgi:hypothetical protein